MWRAVGCFLALGCGRVAFDPPTDGGAVGDRPDADTADATIDAPPACVWGPFGGAAIVPNINSAGNEISMSVRADGLQIVFGTGPTSTANIMSATRASTAQPFGAAAPITELNSPQGEGTVTMTPDGLEVVLVSNRSGGFITYGSRRASITAMFPVPAVVLAPAGMFQDGPELSADALTLYFNYGDFAPQVREIRRATRASVGAMFVDQGPITELDTPQDEALPTISDDELEIIFQSTRSGQARLYRAVRANKTDPFGTPVELTELAPLGSSVSDPELADGGATLYFTMIAASRDIYSATRSCNP